MSEVAMLPETEEQFLDDVIHIAMLERISADNDNTDSEDEKPDAIGRQYRLNLPTQEQVDAVRERVIDIIGNVDLLKPVAIDAFSISYPTANPPTLETIARIITMYQDDTAFLENFMYAITRQAESDLGSPLVDIHGNDYVDLMDLLKSEIANISGEGVVPEDELGKTKEKEQPKQIVEEEQPQEQKPEEKATFYKGERVIVDDGNGNFRSGTVLGLDNHDSDHFWWTADFNHREYNSPTKNAKPELIEQPNVETPQREEPKPTKEPERKSGPTPMARTKEDALQQILNLNEDNIQANIPSLTSHDFIKDTYESGLAQQFLESIGINIDVGGAYSSGLITPNDVLSRLVGEVQRLKTEEQPEKEAYPPEQGMTQDEIDKLLKSTQEEQKQEPTQGVDIAELVKDPNRFREFVLGFYPDNQQETANFFSGESSTSSGRTFILGEILNVIGSSIGYDTLTVDEKLDVNTLIENVLPQAFPPIQKEEPKVEEPKEPGDIQRAFGQLLLTLSPLANYDKELAKFNIDRQTAKQLMDSIVEEQEKTPKGSIGPISTVAYDLFKGLFPSTNPTSKEFEQEMSKAVYVYRQLLDNVSANLYGGEAYWKELANQLYIWVNKEGDISRFRDLIIGVNDVFGRSSAELETDRQGRLRRREKPAYYAGIYPENNDFSAFGRVEAVRARKDHGDNPLDVLHFFERSLKEYAEKWKDYPEGLNKALRAYANGWADEVTAGDINYIVPDPKDPSRNILKPVKMTEKLRETADNFVKMNDIIQQGRESLQGVFSLENLGKDAAADALESLDFSVEGDPLLAARNVVKLIDARDRLLKIPNGESLVTGFDEFLTKFKPLSDYVNAVTKRDNITLPGTQELIIQQAGNVHGRDLEADAIKAGHFMGLIPAINELRAKPKEGFTPEVEAVTINYLEQKYGSVMTEFLQNNNYQPPIETQQSIDNRKDFWAAYYVDKFKDMDPREVVLAINKMRGDVKQNQIFSQDVEADVLQQLELLGQQKGFEKFENIIDRAYEVQEERAIPKEEEELFFDKPLPENLDELPGWTTEKVLWELFNSLGIKGNKLVNAIADPSNVRLNTIPASQAILKAIEDERKNLSFTSEVEEEVIDRLESSNDALSGLSKFVAIQIPRQKEPDTPEAAAMKQLETWKAMYKSKPINWTSFNQVYDQLRTMGGEDYAATYVDTIKADPQGNAIWQQYEVWREKEAKDPKNWKNPIPDDYMNKSARLWTQKDFTDLGKNIGSWVESQLVGRKMDNLAAANYVLTKIMNWDLQKATGTWLYPISVEDAKQLFLAGIPEDVRDMVVALQNYVELERTKAKKKRRNKWIENTIWGLLGGSKHSDLPEDEEDFWREINGTFEIDADSLDVPLQYNVGDETKLAEMNLPIVNEYLDKVAKSRFGVKDFLEEADKKTIKFIATNKKGYSTWEDNETLLVNLFRVTNIRKLLEVLIHEFVHVLTVMTDGDMSEPTERKAAEPEEYVEFPEEEVAYPEQIRFMAFILKMPSDAIKDELIDIVGEENKEKVDEWMKTVLGSVHTAAFPKHPDTIIVKAEYYPDGLTEEEIWTYYDGVKEGIVKELNNQPTMLVIKVDGQVYKRNDESGHPIMIKDIASFDKYNTGRVVEYHKVIGENSKYGFIDIDPNEVPSWDKVKQVTGEVYKKISSLPDVDRVDIAFSGGRGFHLYPYFKEERSINDLRTELEEFLDMYISDSGYADLTTGRLVGDYAIRLDTSTLHRTGSLRVPGSLNANTGLKCTKLSLGKLMNFEKEFAMIGNM